MKMKIANTNKEDNKEDLVDLLNWIKDIPEERVKKFQEVIFNVLRLILDPLFTYQFRQYREKFYIPKAWHIDKKYKEYHTQQSKDHDYVNNLTDEWIEEEMKWSHENPEAIQDGDNKILRDLCRKYYLNPRRYHDFLIAYMKYASILPYIYTMFDDIAIDEARCKTRLVTNPVTEKKFELSVYLRIFKDTSIDEIKDFVDANKPLIKRLQESLEDYPKYENKDPEFLKRDLEIFLMHLLEFPKKAIQLQIEKDFHHLEQGYINTIIREVYAQVISSKDIDYDT